MHPFVPRVTQQAGCVPKRHNTALPAPPVIIARAALAAVQPCHRVPMAASRQLTDLVVQAEGGTEVAGKVWVSWPELADTAFGRDIFLAALASGRLVVQGFERGRMRSVSRGEARVVGLLQGDAGLEKFAAYLRHGMGGKSAPKAAIIKVAKLPDVLLTAHRTKGGILEMTVASPPGAPVTAASAHVPSAASAGSDISKVAAAAAAADAPAEVFAGRDEDLPARVVKQRRRLFEGMADDAVAAMQLDDVALFSVTAAPAANAMTRLIASRVGPGAAVIDGTACVGGNTISFARTFPRVVACEVSAQRCDLLGHNVEAATGKAAVRAESLGQVRAAAEAGAAVTIFHGGVQDLLAVPGAGWPPLGRALFLDPPWGGPEYKLLPKLSLFLGDVNVASLLARVAAEAGRQHLAGTGPLSALSLVALKGPFNLDVDEVLASSRGLLELKERVSMERGRVLLLLLAVKRPKRPRPAADDGGADPSRPEPKALRPADDEA